VTLARLLETLHGHFGVLAAAALLHPALLLRKGHAPSFRVKLAIGLCAGMVMAAFSSGLWIYRGYRTSVRTQLFLKSPATGFLFETKEHIAFSVLAITLGATLTAFAAPRDARGLRRAAAVAYSAAAALCLTTVALGSYIAAVQGF
jgi:hypothetical protein